jgi:hypothetical protein
MKSELSVPELNAIEQSKASQIREVFAPMAEMLESFERKFDEIISRKDDEGVSKELIKDAKRLRLDIGKVRIQTGKLKDEQKKYIKLQDKAIMGVHNILVYAVTEKEDKLKEIEKHFEIQEAKRLQELQEEREKLLSPFVEDAHERDLSKFEQDEFNALLQAKKKQYEDAIKAEEDALKERAEKEAREEEERKALEAENQRLKQEAEEREKEREKAEAKRLVQEMKANQERRRKEREEQERRDKIERELKAKVRAEEEAKRKIEEELKAKARAEEEAKRKAEEAHQAELSKGDADKVKDLIADLEALKTKYSFKSAANKSMYQSVGILLDKVVGHIKK